MEPYAVISLQNGNHEDILMIPRRLDYKGQKYGFDVDDVVVIHKDNNKTLFTFDISTTDEVDAVTMTVDATGRFIPYTK